MTQIEQNPHALAVVAALEAAGLAVGDGVAPRVGAGSSDPFVAPCVVVYMIPGGMIDGPLGDPDADGDGRFQLTSVGRLASEARWYADKALAAVSAPGAVVVPGRSIQRVRPMGTWGGVERDDSVPIPPLFYVTAVFGLFTFSA